MPTINEAILVNTTVISPSQTYAGWGIGALVGASTATAKNTPKAYTSLSALTADHGATTDLGYAGASAFAQGVESIYAVAVDVAGTDPTAAEITAALDTLLTAQNAGSIKAVVLAGIYSDSPLLTAALKTWANENDKIFVVTNPKGATVSEITTAAEPLSSARGFFAAHNTPITETSFVDDVGAAALGVITTTTPGETVSWAKIILPGVGIFADGDIATLEAARVNCVDDLENTSIIRLTNDLTLTTTPTDPAQYIDTIITRMYVTDTIRNALVQNRLSTRKIPYTAAGIEFVRSAIIAAMDQIVAEDVITSEYTVTMPNIADIDSETKMARRLTGIYVTCQESSNMQEFTINLTLEVA